MGTLSVLSGERVYLDTNTFIYALEGYSEFREALIELFDLIEEGQVFATTSELTLAEVLVKPMKDGNVLLQRRYQQILSESNVLQVLPISRNVLIDAARIRSTHGFKLPDAIHIATAVYCQCTFFLTNDIELAGVPHLTTLRLHSLARRG